MWSGGGGVGVASMPASRRWAGVMGVGAPVRGSRPEAALGKAITSRMVGAPASSMHTRSQPNAMPPCGGGPVLERVEQEPELRARLGGRQPDHVEHGLLHRGLVDTDGPAADLVPVAHDVVGVGQRAARLGDELVRPFGQRRRERVVHRGPAAGAVLLEHRRVHHPEERPRRLVDQAAPAPDLQPRRAEQFPGRRGRARGEEHAVTRPGAGGARPARTVRPRTGSWPPAR